MGWALVRGWHAGSLAVYLGDTRQRAATAIAAPEGAAAFPAQMLIGAASILATPDAPGVGTRIMPISQCPACAWQLCAGA